MQHRAVDLYRDAVAAGQVVGKFARTRMNIGRCELILSAYQLLHQRHPRDRLVLSSNFVEAAADGVFQHGVFRVVITIALKRIREHRYKRDLPCVVIPT